VDADGRVLRTLGAMPPLLIKPNLEELAALTGKTGPVDAMLDTALALGFRGILLSRGADGLVHADMAGRRVQKSPAVTAVNTVGAGDACLAGYLAARYEGLELPDRLAWAAAAGAASVRERFAGMIDKAWFERELRKLPRGS
jgi:tagatose 6-phosphate kinase